MFAEAFRSPLPLLPAGTSRLPSLVSEQGQTTGKVVWRRAREPAAPTEATYSSFLGISGDVNQPFPLLVLSFLTIYFPQDFIRCLWDDHLNMRGYETDH